MLIKRIKNYIRNYFKNSLMDYINKRSFTNGEIISDEEAKALLKKIDEEIK